MAEWLCVCRGSLPTTMMMNPVESTGLLLSEMAPACWCLFNTVPSDFLQGIWWPKAKWDGAVWRHRKPIDSSLSEPAQLAQLESYLLWRDKPSCLLQSCVCQLIATVKGRRKSLIPLWQASCSGVFLFLYKALKAIFIFYPTEWFGDFLL